MAWCATGKAAQRLGRDFIGIEMSEHWHDVARRDIEQAQPEPVPLFQ